MRSWVIAAGLLAALPSQEEARVFVEVLAAPQTYVSQPTEVLVRIGYDADWFAQHAVPLIRQQVDVPCHLDVPWLGATADRTVVVVPFAGDLGVAQVAVADQIVAGVRALPLERRGRLYEQVMLRFRWLPLAAGLQEVAPVTVRFAYADEFREHLLRGREPVDRKEQRVSSPARELLVQPVPENAPSDWSGAVGEFVITATSGGRQLHVGEAFSVEVTIHGEGNLDQFAGIKPPRIDGFYVQGVVEVATEGARRFQLDVLALRPGLTEMPGVPLVVFSPERGKFVTLTSETVPVRVLPPRPDVELSDRIQELVDQDAASQSDGPGWVIRWAFITFMLIGLWLHRYGRIRRGRRSLQDALHELRLAVGVGGNPVKVAEAFERVLARVAGGGPFSAPSIWADLETRGVAPEGIASLKELHQALDGARFGGPMPDKEAVMGPVETLVAAC